MGSAGAAPATRSSRIPSPAAATAVVLDRRAGLQVQLPRLVSPQVVELRRPSWPTGRAIDSTVLRAGSISARKCASSCTTANRPPSRPVRSLPARGPADRGPDRRRREYNSGQRRSTCAVRRRIAHGNHGPAIDRSSVLGQLIAESSRSCHAGAPGYRGSRLPVSRKPSISASAIHSSRSALRYSKLAWALVRWLVSRSS